MSKKTGPTIKPHASGKLYTTLTVNGKKQFIYGESEEEVTKKYIELKYLHNQGYNIGDNPSMTEYAIRWYNTFKRDKGAVKTQEMYANIVNVHIVPALGKKRVKEIKTTDVQNLLNKTDSSKSLQHKLRITLNQIFNKAIADRLIAFNPIVGTDQVDTDEPERNFLTKTQREILAAVLHDHKVFPLAHTVLNTGMRVTEAIALMRKRDIDLEAKKIYVRESTEFVNYQPDTKDTKTKRGKREIPIHSAFVAFLDEHLKTKKSLYVFPGHHGGQMGQTELKNMQRRSDAKLQKWFDENPEMDKHRFRLHFKTLRHTYCTELFDVGIDEVSAAAIMGHTVEVMRTIYTHIKDERKAMTAAKIENLYKDNVLELPQKVEKDA